MMEDGNDGWLEYRKLILNELERLNIGLVGLNAKIDIFRETDISQMKVDIAMLKVKAGTFGALAGSIGGALIAMLVARFSK